MRISDWSSDVGSSDRKTGGMNIEREQARKMIFIGDDEIAHLSYVVSFFADAADGGAPTRPFIIVDAHSGAILKRWEGLTTAQIGTAPGGNTKHGSATYRDSGCATVYIPVVPVH